MSEPHPMSPKRLNGQPLHAERDRGIPRPGIDAILGDDLNWVSDAAICAQSDPDVWHPERGGDNRVAKLLCQSCPLVVPCLQYALDHHRVEGIWGSTSEQERRDLLRRRRVA